MGIGEGRLGMAMPSSGYSADQMDGPQHLKTGRVTKHGHMPPGTHPTQNLSAAQQALIANINKADKRIAQVCMCLLIDSSIHRNF